jgi:N-acetylglucosaminyldiphosphoundecaprenol N-acetyl-beta-D-mannosaminyltransferase
LVLERPRTNQFAVEKARQRSRCAKQNGRIDFLDLGFDALSMADLLDWLGRRGPDSPYAYLVTPNIDHMVRLEREGDAMRPLYQDADLCVCDGRNLARLAGLCGVSLPIIHGSEVVRLAFEQILAAQDRICVIGANAAIMTELARRYSRIDFAHHAPPMNLRHDPAARAEAAAFARASGARLTLLTVGSPQQEMIAHEEAMRGGGRGTWLCVGGSLDYLTGVRARAPRIVQLAGLEFAWRVAGEPRRLARRYLWDGLAILPMAWRWYRRRPVRKDT